MTIRRGTLLSFNATDWTALVFLDGADAESQIPVGQWVPSAMLTANSDVAVLVFGATNTDDGVVLGPYGAVSLWDYPALTGLTTGQPLRASSASAAAFGALDLANANAVTGVLPEANLAAVGTWTPAFVGSGTAGVFTYGAQVGFHWVIGNLVFIIGTLKISAIGTPPTGTMSISGLPFTSKNTPNEFGGVAFTYLHNFNYTALALALLGAITTNTTRLDLFESFDNTAAVAAPAANFTNAACQIGFIGVYPK